MIFSTRRNPLNRLSSFRLFIFPFIFFLLWSTHFLFFSRLSDERDTLSALLPSSRSLSLSLSLYLISGLEQVTEYFVLCISSFGRGRAVSVVFRRDYNRLFFFFLFFFFLPCFMIRPWHVAVNCRKSIGTHHVIAVTSRWPTRGGVPPKRIITINDTMEGNKFNDGDLSEISRQKKNKNKRKATARCSTIDGSSNSSAPSIYLLIYLFFFPVRR